MGNSTSFNNDSKNQQHLLNIFSKMIDNKLLNQQGVKYYPATVVSVSGNLADVEINWGITPAILKNINNRSNNILTIGDVVQVVAPSGNLTNCYIGTCYNTEPKLAAENILGVLSMGDIYNQNGMIVFYDSNTHKQSMSLQNYSIYFDDFLGTAGQVGEIGVFRVEDSNGNATGAPVINITSEIGASTIIGVRNSNSTSSRTILEVSNNSYNEGEPTAYMHAPFYINASAFVNSDSTHALYIDNVKGNQLYGSLNVNGWDLDSIRNVSCTNLTVSGSKNYKINSSLGDTFYYAEESSESWLNHSGFGTITDNQCIIYFNPLIIEALNTNINYIFKFYPDSNCNYKIEKHPNYVLIITTNLTEDLDFSYELKAKRKGHEYKNLGMTNKIENLLYQAKPQDITKNLKSYGTDMIMKALLYPQIDENN